MFERPYGEYRYVFAARSSRPFKSKGVYGFSHGGFTPQEIVIPNVVFSKAADSVKGLEVLVTNREELAEVTGDFFNIKIGAASKGNELFSVTRKIQLLIYANNLQISNSNIITMEVSSVQSFEFSFAGHTELTGVLVDATTQEQIDSVKIKKSNARDLGGLI